MVDSESLETRLSVMGAQAADEVFSRLLPFWDERVFTDDGWMVGALEHDLTPRWDVPRHSVIVARILWSFSAAARASDDPAQRQRWIGAGERARAILTGPFWDDEESGVYWSLAEDRTPASDRKQVYAQAFAIYGLAEWYAATGDAEALDRARALFHLLERNSRDPSFGGYVEAHDRAWGELENVALSERDLNAPKSMNTNLHVLEAYTTLLEVTGDAAVADALESLLDVSLERIFTFEPWPHCRLFFDLEWWSQTPNISWGHDIEASWLLWEAAAVVGDDGLTARTREASLALADAVLDHGVDPDGSILYEGTPTEILEAEKHWWPQAEGVVGWLNAYEMTGEERYAEASLRLWDYIGERVIDRERGEWFAVLSREGEPLLESGGGRKMGPWKGPYHNARACLEVARRTAALPRNPDRGPGNGLP